MTVLPFSDFLELLRAKGFGVGLHEHLALGKLLSRWDSIDRDELRGAIAALVARREDEVVAILRLFDEVYPRDVVQPSEAAREPKEPTRKYRLVQLAKARSFWLAAVVLAVLLPLGVAYFNYMDLNWPQPPAVAVALPSLPVPNPIAPPTPLPDTLIEYQADPSSTLPTPPVNFKWLSLAALGGTSLAVTLVALWGVRMRRSAREWTVDAWHKALAAMPGPYHSSLILNDLVTRLPREDLEEAATLLGRAFARDALGRELDVPRTLQQTLRAGLRPHLVYKPRRVQETIVVLIDHSQAMNAHARRVNGFVADLARYGIAMERWYFDGDVAVQSPRPFGPPVALENLVRRREHSPALIISAGFEVAATLQSKDRGWLRALQSWSRRVWLNPIADESLWPSALVRMPVPVVGMNRAGLLRAANILARGENEAVGVSGRTFAARPVTLDDVDELKQLSSVVPYPTIELLELLRQRFAPQVPEAAVFHVPPTGRSFSGVPIEMSDGEIRDNLRRLRRDRASFEARVREYLLDVLRDSEPVAGSVAHLRWQVSTAIHEVQLAALRGADASAGLRKIAALAHGPLWDELRESIARLPDSGPLADDVRKTAGMKERSADPPSFEDRTGGLGVPRFRWVLPSARELGFSLGVALLAAAIASVAAPFRAQASHVLNAYTLDYEPPQARELAGVLRVRSAATPTAPPRRFQVYQDDQPFGGPLDLDADGSAAVRVESSGEAHVYQVRGDLPTGALAVSNALLAPSVLVVIDAQPWARATIRSSGDRIRPITDVTPVAVRLPEGTYELAFENGGVTQPLTQQIDVTTAGLRVFRFDMPGFDPQALLRQLESPAAARMRR